jgi:hypothetical protein
LKVAQKAVAFVESLAGVLVRANLAVWKQGAKTPVLEKEHRGGFMGVEDQGKLVCPRGGVVGQPTKQTANLYPHLSCLVMPTTIECGMALSDHMVVSHHGSHEFLCEM